MKLDPEICYQAILSRDRRFDGRFFTGVVTTGIYCRPICPVHPPKFENVRFFACAAAAEAAGFRPCRRCHPETAPGTPAWLGSSAVVSRALRLISEGALDEAGIDAMSARLGIGARQLRRLFAEHLGASPAAIARARRVHFAVKLIEETTLPITEIAFSSGFSSIRQFNHAVRATFGQSPTERRLQYGLKRNGKTPHHLHNGAGLIVRLPYRPPLDWAAMLRFLETRAIPGVEVVGAESYQRTIEIGGLSGTIELKSGDAVGCLTMNVQLPRYDGLLLVIERVKRLFDLSADPMQISEHLRRSPILCRSVENSPGLRVPGTWDVFELSLKAVLGQQISVKGAATLAGRLAKSYGRPLDGHCTPGLTHLFPIPEALVDAELSQIGIPKARAMTIRTLARRIHRGELVLDASRSLDDVVASLCAIPGIGPWTANYIAMRALGETDAFPADDLWLRRALSNGVALLSTEQVTDAAEAWRPWRAYAAMHLWTSRITSDNSIGKEGGRRNTTYASARTGRTISQAPRR
jgi:AraC family transcriptional regulator, regulatory protein of adaptative response / DNA-3-methyladenine glycosylase II